MIQVSVSQQFSMKFKRLENCIAYLCYLTVLNCWGWNDGNALGSYSGHARLESWTVFAWRV